MAEKRNNWQKKGGKVSFLFQKPDKTADFCQKIFIAWGKQ